MHNDAGWRDEEARCLALAVCNACSKKKGRGAGIAVWQVDNPEFPRLSMS